MPPAFLQNKNYSFMDMNSFCCTQPNIILFVDNYLKTPTVFCDKSLLIQNDLSAAVVYCTERIHETRVKKALYLFCLTKYQVYQILLNLLCEIGQVQERFLSLITKSPHRTANVLYRHVVQVAQDYSSECTVS